MILILAGTQDARELAISLRQLGFPITASVISKYGEFLYENLEINVQSQVLDAETMRDFIIAHSITTVIDATHPYAMNVSKTSLAICETLNIPYIRYERAKTILPSYDKMSIVTNYDEAVSLAASIGKRIFLTIGSRNLKYFAKLLENKKYFLVARVLPDEAVLHECFSMGFMPNQLILMQGPFSQTLNLELYKKYQADVIITKDSGAVGGTDTKISAAIELNLPIIMIARPRLVYKTVANTLDEVIYLLEKNKINQ